MDQTTEHQIGKKFKSAVKSFTLPGADQPIVSTSAIRAEIVSSFKYIDELEERIKNDREEIADIVKALVAKGLNKKAIKLALARRRLASDEKLADVDASMRVICGIGSLGIQGDLFSSEGNGIG